MFWFSDYRKSGAAIDLEKNWTKEDTLVKTIIFTS